MLSKPMVMLGLHFPLQAVAASAIQAVMAGSCQRILSVPPNMRSADDIDTLSDLLGELEVSW